MGGAATWISCGGYFKVNPIKNVLAVRTGAATAMIAIVCGNSRCCRRRSRRPRQSDFLALTESDSQLQPPTLQLAAEPATAPAPASETDDEDDKDVPTSQVDKYISVYESMQKDHNITVEQATSKQGLTVAQFRALENKIEADDTLRERVRKALRHAANPNDKESSDD